MGKIVEKSANAILVELSDEETFELGRHPATVALNFAAQELGIHPPDWSAGYKERESGGVVVGLIRKEAIWKGEEHDEAEREESRDGTDGKEADETSKEVAGDEGDEGVVVLGDETANNETAGGNDE